MGQLVRCFLHVGASSCLISVFGNETNHQTVSVRGDKAPSLPEPPAAGQGPSPGAASGWSRPLSPTEQCQGPSAPFPLGSLLPLFGCP